MKKNIYEEIWKDVLPDIIDVIADGQLHDNVDMSTDKDRFMNVGDRENSGYGFRLHFVNGNVCSITNSAVARDLRNVLLKSSKFVELAKGKEIIFRMGVKFVLEIIIK